MSGPGREQSITDAGASLDFRHLQSGLSAHLLDEFPEVSMASRKPTITFELPGTGTVNKTVALRRIHQSDGGWDTPTEEEARSGFEAALRVRSSEEAKAVISILEHKAGLIISDTDDAHFKVWLQRVVQFTHFADGEEGSHELRLKPTRRGLQKDASVMLLRSLLNCFELHGNERPVFETRSYDLSNAADRRAWAHDTFHDWYLQLSGTELQGLRSIGSADYHTIHRSLRGDIGLGEWDSATIMNVDTAIRKGVLQRDLLLFRAVGDPFIELVKTLTSCNEEIRFSDPAYLFFSLHREIAESWKRGLSRGVLLEIEIPKGTSGAFLQVPGVFPERNHDEILLARNTKLLLTGLRLNKEGQPEILGRVTV